MSWLVLGSLHRCGALVAPLDPLQGVRCLGCSLDPVRGCGVLVAPWISSGGAVSWLLLGSPPGVRCLGCSFGSPPGGAVSWLLLGSPPGVRCLGGSLDPLRGCGVLVRCLVCSLDPLRGRGALAAPWIPSGGAVSWLLLGSPSRARCLGCSFGSPPGGAVSWLLLRSPPGVRCLGCSLDPLRGRGALVAPLDPLP